MPELLGTLNRAWTARFMTELKNGGFLDVTPAFAAIMPLIDPQGTRQSDMARKSGLTKQAIGQLIKELVARGYAEISVDPHDSRARLVTFTPRGLALRKRGFIVKESLSRQMTAAVPTSELDALATSLRKLLSGLQDP